jgi:hypothetical protein
MRYPHLIAVSSWLFGGACIVGGFPEWAWPFALVAGYAFALTKRSRPTEPK